MAQHQRGQLAAVDQTEVLPEMIWPRCSAGNQDRKDGADRSRSGAGAEQQPAQGLLVVRDRELAIQTEGFEHVGSAGKVGCDDAPKLFARDTQTLRERTAGIELRRSDGKDRRQHVRIEGIPCGGHLRLAQARVQCDWCHGASPTLPRGSGSSSGRPANMPRSRYTRRCPRRS